MGDILSKLKMVSEKMGVIETAHTIEEQIDLISEALDKTPTSTNIAEALDDLSEVAKAIGINYSIALRFSDGSVEYYLDSGDAIGAINADSAPKVEAYIGLYVQGVQSGQFVDCYNLAKVMIPNQLYNIGNNAFDNCPNLTEIIIDRPENSISGAPWGATNATITWTGRPVPDSENHDDDTII